MENQEENKQVTPPAMTPEEAQRKFEEVQAKLEALRIPLEETTSTDTIQRIRAIKDILDLKISYPKYVEEKRGKEVFRKVTGSYEVSLFPSFGDTEQENLLVRITFTNLLNRLIELSKKL